MIKIDNLVKIYGNKKAVDIESLELPAGAIIGLVGNNGAGKTTLFRLILDLIRADRGSIELRGETVAQSERWKNFTAAYVDEGFLIGYLTPEEYFYFTGNLHGISKPEVDNRLQSFEAFFDGSILKSGKYIRDLSKGNQFKVGAAACLLSSPELLILDEPFANLDPSSQLRLIKMLREEQAKNQTTIVVSSHDLNHIAETCDRILLMEKGSIVRNIEKTAATLEELETYFQVS